MVITRLHDLRLWCRPLAVIALLLTLLAMALPAQAAGGDRITDYRVDYTLGADGVLRGHEEIHYTFGPGTRRGIFVYYTVRDNVSDEMYRLYDMDITSVTSPSGAPAAFTVSDEGAALKVQIGDESQTVSGEQVYVIDYTVRGTVNRIAGQDGQADTQELYINPVASRWSAEIDTATATVSAPAPATNSRCFVDKPNGKDESRCRIGSAGDTTTFTTSDIREGEGMTVVAAYPMGTVSDDQPILVEGDANGGPAIDEVMPAWVQTGLVGTSVGVGALAAVGTGIAAARAYRRGGRDRGYADVAPGVIPASAGGATQLASKAGPVAVRFEPPAGARPGMIGTLIDEKADTEDATATVVDLAVRGYVRIEEIEGEKDWLLVRTTPADPEPLLEYEETILEALLGEHNRVRLSDRRQKASALFSTGRDQMDAEVTEAGWFAESPQAVRRRWQIPATVLANIGIVLVAVALVFGLVVPMSVWMLLGLAAAGVGLIIGGLIAWLAGRAMPRRTPEGVALLNQARGFEKYLSTAEAGQIRFEEAGGIFSRYLPYAIIFGLTDRWVRVFEEVTQAAAAEGFAIDVPTWYLMSGHWNGLAFASALGSFSDTAGTTLAAPPPEASSSPGSAGSSGFGGGGFSGGGGFGGGGGGSW